MFISRMVRCVGVPMFVAIVLLSCDKSPSGPSYSVSDIAGNWIAETYRLNIKVKTATGDIPIDTSIAIPDGEIYMYLHGDNTYRARMALDDFLDIIGIIMDRIVGPVGKTANSGMTRKTLATVVDTGTWSMSGTVISTHSIVGVSTRPMPVAVHGDTLVGTGTVDLDMPPVSVHDPFTITFRRK